MARSRLAARIRALEQIAGPDETTVIIRHFGPSGPQPVQCLSDGDVVVERGVGEESDAFRARAVATLRGGRRGLVVLTENGGD